MEQGEPGKESNKQELEKSQERREAEPTVAEVLEKALAEGYIEEGDLEYFGEDLDDVLTNVTDYILQSGDDPDEAFARWGLTVEPEEQTE